MDQNFACWNYLDNYSLHDQSCSTSSTIVPELFAGIILLLENDVVHLQIEGSRWNIGHRSP